MEPLPMYPALTKENKIAGLEFVDFLLLVGVYLVVFIFSKNLILNLALIFTAYLFLRLYKHKKPPRYTQALIKFLILPGKYTTAREAKP